MTRRERPLMTLTRVMGRLTGLLTSILSLRYPLSGHPFSPSSLFFLSLFPLFFLSSLFSTYGGTSKSKEITSFVSPSPSFPLPLSPSPSPLSPLSPLSPPLSLTSINTNFPCRRSRRMTCRGSPRPTEDPMRRGRPCWMLTSSTRATYTRCWRWCW